jgi:hypothetical protein
MIVPTKEGMPDASPHPVIGKLESVCVWMIRLSHGGHFGGGCVAVVPKRTVEVARALLLRRDSVIAYTDCAVGLWAEGQLTVNESTANTLHSAG